MRILYTQQSTTPAALTIQPRFFFHSITNWFKMMHADLQLWNSKCGHAVIIIAPQAAYTYLAVLQYSSYISSNNAIFVPTFCVHARNYVVEEVAQAERAVLLLFCCCYDADAWCIVMACCAHSQRHIHVTCYYVQSIFSIKRQIYPQSKIR